MEEDKIIRVCFDKESIYYTEMALTEKASWDKRDREIHWNYWREATGMENDLFLMGWRRIPRSLEEFVDL